jgi:hypothetical protein
MFSRTPVQDYWARQPRGRSSSTGRIRSLLHVFQTGPGAHPATYSLGSGARSRHAKLILPTDVEVSKSRDLYIHSLHTSSWCSAQLAKRKDKFTSPYIVPTQFEGLGHPPHP